MLKKGRGLKRGPAETVLGPRVRRTARELTEVGSEKSS